MTMNSSMNPLQQVLANMFKSKADDPNPTVQCQIVLQGGFAAAGSLKVGPVEGTYQLRSDIHDPRTGKKLGEVDMIFLADFLIGIQTPVEKKLVETSSSVLSIPRLS